MGGKSYFCDYCRCFLKTGTNVRTHNSGLAHQIARAKYLHRFKDPRKLLAEETNKVPCTRFPKGFCKFDLFCKYTHFTERQLQELRRTADEFERKSRRKQTNNPELPEWTQRLRWAKADHLRGHRKLPPSLKINLSQINAELVKSNWG